MKSLRKAVFGIRSCQTTLTRTNFTTVNSKKPATSPSDSNPIPRQLRTTIKATGPLTVAEYMRHVLTCPSGGYYMHRDVLGPTGDFVTSPELGQMFGELIAVWFLNEWHKAGSPGPLQIVELGPGRGSLSQDLLRVFDHFKALKGASLHLIEVSPLLSDLQSRMLCLQSHNVDDPQVGFYKQGLSHRGVPVRWYRQLQDVPTDGFSLFLAHEFFDALPVHKFQRTAQGYREILIDHDGSSGDSFRYVISREATPASQMFIRPNETREHLEVSPHSLTLVKSLADRVECDGGLALIADYGHDGTGTDTFRAFKQHKLHDPLVEPGSADLTADVDFGRLKEIAVQSGGVMALGPVSQREFLLNMGIEERFKALESANQKDEKRVEGLRFGFRMMVEKEQMGERFRFMGLVPSVLGKIYERFPAAGFGPN